MLVYPNQVHSGLFFKTHPGIRCLHPGPPNYLVCTPHPQKKATSSLKPSNVRSLRFVDLQGVLDPGVLHYEYIKITLEIGIRHYVMN
jgi:hypothetical protein